MLKLLLEFWFARYGFLWFLMWILVELLSSFPTVSISCLFFRCPQLKFMTHALIRCHYFLLLIFIMLISLCWSPCVLVIKEVELCVLFHDSVLFTVPCAWIMNSFLKKQKSEKPKFQVVFWKQMEWLIKICIGWGLFLLPFSSVFDHICITPSLRGVC